MSGKACETGTSTENSLIEEFRPIYKKICRYYFAIDPDTTVSYIYAYRDMWDNEGGRQDE